MSYVQDFSYLLSVLTVLNPLPHHHHSIQIYLPPETNSVVYQIIQQSPEIYQLIHAGTSKTIEKENLMDLIYQLAISPREMHLYWGPHAIISYHYPSD